MQTQHLSVEQKMDSPYGYKAARYSSHTLLAALFPEVGNGRRVLDVGCAEGHLARRLADRGLEVVGIDRPGPKPETFPPNVRLVQADLDLGMPSLPETFDFILCADIIEHLRDPQHFLLDLLPHFTSGGRLIASLPNSGNLYFRLNVWVGRFPAHDRGLFDRTHLHFLTWQRWQEMLSRTGFHIEKVQPTGMPIGLAFPRWEQSWVMRALERIAYGLARAWMTLFAYQFVVVARPEAPR
jgi:2-polyprenyl-3-methyl-5-hydroxy-6-metoxy-1,4-benzoquinol methylase